MLEVKLPSFSPGLFPAASSATSAALNPDALRSFVNSTSGRALISRLNSPALAQTPIVKLDSEATRHILQALGKLPPLAPHPKRRPSRPAVAPRQASPPAPSPSEPAYDFVVVRSRAAKPARLPGKPVARTATMQGLTPQQTIVVGTGGGALFGAGVAQLFNSVRHVDPTGVGSVIFALAGALAGAGAGMLVGAKIVSPTKVNLPGVSVAFKPV